MRWMGHVACMWERRDAYGDLLGKPEGKRPPGRPKRKWKDIKMKFQVEWGGINWIKLAQNRDRWRTLVNSVMNLRVA